MDSARCYMGLLTWSTTCYIEMSRYVVWPGDAALGYWSERALELEDPDRLEPTPGKFVSPACFQDEALRDLVRYNVCSRICSYFIVGHDCGSFRPLQRSLEPAIDGQSVLPCLLARYRQIVFDSHRMPSSSSITGTRPFGFIARNSGTAVGLKPLPQSSRS